MRTPGIATSDIRGRADAIPTDSRSDPRMTTMGRQICQGPSLLLRQLVGCSRIFREESHRGEFRFWLVARSRLRASLVLYSQNPRDAINTYLYIFDYVAFGTA
jgi:hypothetical protein